MTAESAPPAPWPGRPTRFTDWLRSHSEPAWTAATTHRFTRELADAVLDLDVLRRYLVQDHSFLGSFVQLLDAAIRHAPHPAARERFVAFRAVITGEENTYFMRAFYALDVPREVWAEPTLLPVTHAFHTVMREAAAGGRYAEIVTVLVVTEWVYLEWASALVHIQAEAFYFAEWIDLHANDDFRSFVGFLRDELDRAGEAASEAERMRILELFRKAVRLEQQFFDAAYG